MPVTITGSDLNTPGNDNISFKLRVEPSGECIDTVYYNNSDIIYGFGRTRDEIDRLINQCNFNLSNRIWLTINNERVKPSLCHFERNFGIDNGRDIWATFKLNEQQQRYLKQTKKVSLFVNNFFRKEKTAVFSWPVRELLSMEKRKNNQG